MVMKANNAAIFDGFEWIWWHIAVGETNAEENGGEQFTLGGEGAVTCPRMYQRRSTDAMLRACVVLNVTPCYSLFYAIANYSESTV
jgi:hypothetical protein